MWPSPFPRQDHRAALIQLDELLRRWEGLWRPAPFHQARPDWCDRLPALAAQLLALDEDRAEALADDPAALLALLTSHVPELAELGELIRLPRLERQAEFTAGRWAWGVPGRKLAQIQAFAAAVGEPRGPVLEWCAGKGHLGRLLAGHWHTPATSLEIDAGLCADGATLARRAGVAQAFMAGDALDPAAAVCLTGRHAVALHACGDLHLALLRGAVEQGAPALDLAPCCYYRTAVTEYRPFNPEAGLGLSRDELHLPVTETVTAGARERRQRDRHMAWKLGFLALRETLDATPGKTTFKPVPAAWLGLDFAGFIRRLATREGLALPDGLDLAQFEARGWQRRHEVARLGLVRLAFRRPLEIWLALDRALYLERAGYAARLAEFCARQLTPRNLLISARR
jgi:hypothetical protein